MNNWMIKTQPLKLLLTGLRLTLAITCMFHCGGPAAAQENISLVKANQLFTVDGEVLSPGQVLIEGGRIVALGESVEAPENATTIEVDTLMPGIINTAGDTGLSDNGAEVSREIVPDFQTLDAIDWLSRDFKEALDQGVTTVQILPSTESVFAGFACVVKTAGDDPVVTDRQGVLLAVCADPTSRNRSRSRPDSIYVRQPTNRMGVVWIVRRTLHRAQQPDADLPWTADTQEILHGILTGEHSVLCVSRTDFDIRSALKLGQDHGFQPTIYGGDEVYRMMDDFKASGARLVYTALTTNASASALRGSEGTELRWNVPGRLHSSGIPFCLAGPNLLDQARFATRFGLPRDEALKAITLYPAQTLAMEDQLGSITTGKQADLVALTGDPLEPTSRVLWTMVGGEIYGN
ncbi:MAG: amidohydrolase family protein [bacterium]|nr:amidohydrolase family protein [bacterium]